MCTEKQFQLVTRAGFEPGSTELNSSALNHSAVLPPPPPPKKNYSVLVSGVAENSGKLHVFRVFSKMYDLKKPLPPF